MVVHGALIGCINGHQENHEKIRIKRAFVIFPFRPHLSAIHHLERMVVNDDASIIKDHDYMALSSALPKNVRAARKKDGP